MSPWRAKSRRTAKPRAQSRRTIKKDLKMTNIGAQMRDNPLPLLLISAGVGLMMSRSFRNDGYHGGFSMYRDDASGDLMRRTADRTAGFGNERDDYGSRASSSASGMMSSVRDTVSSMTDTVSSQASSLVDT